LLPESRIQRSSPVPLYFQLVRALREEILSGRWAPGAQLASEPDLGTHFGVSRTVVRQALGRLEDEGLLIREKGRGTFVADGRDRSWLLQSSEGFFQDEAERHGLPVSSRVLRNEVAVLPDWAADALGLPRGSAGVTIARLRLVDGKVALYTENHLIPDVAGIVLGLAPDASLYEELERQAGLVIDGGRRVVEAVTAGEQLGSLLEVPRDAALAFIESVSWDDQLRVFDCYQAWLRTDRTRIEVQVTRAAHGRAGTVRSVTQVPRPVTAAPVTDGAGRPD
jgi:GntR family transcriptional regulator